MAVQSKKPMDVQSFLLESYCDMRSWFRVISRGIMISIVMAGVFSAFIIVRGMGFFFENYGEYLPGMTVEGVKWIGRLLEIASYLGFGIGGAVAMKKTSPVSVFRMISDHLDREEKRESVGVEMNIGLECENCGQLISVQEMKMLQNGAPLRCPSDQCLERDSDGCLYHWCRTIAPIHDDKTEKKKIK